VALGSHQRCPTTFGSCRAIPPSNRTDSTTSISRRPTGCNHRWSTQDDAGSSSAPTSVESGMDLRRVGSCSVTAGRSFTISPRSAQRRSPRALPREGAADSTPPLHLSTYSFRQTLLDVPGAAVLLAQVGKGVVEVAEGRGGGGPSRHLGAREQWVNSALSALR
jgi:hypothetical protein